MADRQGRGRLRELWEEHEFLVMMAFVVGVLAVIIMVGEGMEPTPLNFLVAVGLVVGVWVLWWVAVGVLYTLGPGRRIRWRRRRAGAAAARRHPGAVLVPGFAAGSMYGLVLDRRAEPRAWRKSWGSELQVVFAVLPDRVEVWVPGEPEPLWSVRRIEGGVRIERASVQSDYGTDIERDELWFRDGEAAAGIFPEYATRLLVLRDYPAEDLERALREIGLEPGDVPRKGLD